MQRMHPAKFPARLELYQRQVIYSLKTLSLSEQLKAARQLVVDEEAAAAARARARAG